MNYLLIAILTMSNPQTGQIVTSNIAVPYDDFVECVRAVGVMKERTPDKYNNGTIGLAMCIPTRQH